MVNKQYFYVLKYLAFVLIVGFSCIDSSGCARQEEKILACEPKTQSKVPGFEIQHISDNTENYCSINSLKWNFESQKNIEYIYSGISKMSTVNEFVRKKQPENIITKTEGRLIISSLPDGTADVSVDVEANVESPPNIWKQVLTKSILCINSKGEESVLSQGLHEYPFLVLTEKIEKNIEISMGERTRQAIMVITTVPKGIFLVNESKAVLLEHRYDVRVSDEEEFFRFYYYDETYYDFSKNIVISAISHYKAEWNILFTIDPETGKKYFEKGTVNKEENVLKKN